MSLTTNHVRPGNEINLGPYPDPLTNLIFSNSYYIVVDRSERVIASNVFAETDFPSMVRGRVVLIGDAAHSMTSFFGQGACQAIEDAAELANALSAHYSTSAPVPLSQALQSFSTSRERRARDITSFSANYAKLHTARLPYGLGPAARKFVYAWLPVWGWMWCLKWLYGYQPTVNEVSLFS